MVQPPEPSIDENCTLPMLKNKITIAGKFAPRRRPHLEKPHISNFRQCATIQHIYSIAEALLFLKTQAGLQSVTLYNFN